jgi:glycosyltransferase involved in cell wall biosynthesis
LISFIIPAHNEEPLLSATLDALDASASTLGRPYEVIVVDDGSTDGTVEIAARHGVRLLSVDLRQISATRNAGARVAHGELLIFVDADTLVNVPVLTAAVRAIEGGAVGGGATVDWEGTLPGWGRVLVVITTWAMRVAKYAAGCFIFTRRSAFHAVGGFDERLFAAEEIVLSRALKRRGRFVILRETVTTSGRKLRTHSPMELARMTSAFVRHGFDAFRDRRHLGLWYGERRHDKPSIAEPRSPVSSWLLRRRR